MVNKKLIRENFIEFKAFLKEKPLLVKLVGSDEWLSAPDQIWDYDYKDKVEAIVIDDELREVRKELKFPRGIVEVMYSSHNRWYPKSHHKLRPGNLKGSAKYRVVLNHKELVNHNNKLFSIDRVIIQDNIKYLQCINDELLPYDNVQIIENEGIYLSKTKMQYLMSLGGGMFIDKEGASHMITTDTLVPTDSSIYQLFKD